MCVAAPPFLHPYRSLLPPAARSLTPGSLPFFSKLWTIPKWAQWAPGGPSTPAGNLTNTILFDKEGAPRTGGYNAPGALVRVYPPDRH